MLITRRSIHSGIVRTLDLPINEAEFLAYTDGALIQDAFPRCDADQREFFMTGMTADEWDRMFPKEKLNDPVE